MFLLELKKCEANVEFLVVAVRLVQSHSVHSVATASRLH